MEETHGAAGTLWPGCDVFFLCRAGNHLPAGARCCCAPGRHTERPRSRRRKRAAEPSNAAQCSLQGQHGTVPVPCPREESRFMVCPAGLPKAPPQDGATPQSLCRGPLSSPGSLAANSSFWKMKSGKGKTASYTTASAPRSSCESHNVSLGGAGHQPFPQRWS